MEDRSPGVKEDVKKLCRCLLDAAFHSMSDADGLLAALRLPSMNVTWDLPRREAEVRGLVHLAYDIVLLRKWTWFGDWDATPLSPLCWCVARGYEYHVKGRRRDGERLASALKDFSDGCNCLQEKEPILKFLALLSGALPDPQPVEMDTSEDSGVVCYDLYPSSVFEQLPGSSQLSPVHQAIEACTSLFTCAPASGFRGFLSVEPLNVDKTPAASTLFDGLAHSSTASLHTPLHLPTLPSHPHLLYLHPPHHHPSVSTSQPPPLPPSPPPSHSTSTSPTFCPWSEPLAEDIPTRSWEGWQHSLPYLTEAGEEALTHAQFLSGVHLLYCEGKPHPQLPHPLNEECLIDSQSLAGWMERGSLARAFGSALSRLIVFEQTTVDHYHGSEAMVRHTGAIALQPLIFLLTSLKSDCAEGLALVDILYQQCCAVQGTPHYPLLLSLLSLTIAPYIHFLSRWVFCGWLDEGEEFGIHSNHHALQCRDHRYWTQGYVAADQCTPTFLSPHGHTLLACGKALNLLRLCCPKHPLCGRMPNHPPVIIATSLEQLELLTQQCQDYLDHVSEMVEEEKVHRLLQAEALEQEALQDVLRARREARQAVQALRDREHQMLVEEKRDKAMWFQELQARATEARLLRVRQEAEERERDREMVAVLVGRDDALTAHERRLAEEARAELVAHYEALGRDANLRRLRAEWREARLRLTTKRRQWLEEEGERWREEELTAAADIAIESHSSLSSPPPPPCNGIGLGSDHHSQGESTSGSPAPPWLAPETPPSPPHLSGVALAQDHTPSTATEHLIHYGESGSGDGGDGGGDSSDGGDGGDGSGDSGDGGDGSGDGGVPPPPITRGVPPPPITRGVPPPPITRGVPPPSTVQDLLHPSGDPPDHHRQSSRGHAPQTTIQHLLYPLNHDHVTATPTKATPITPVVSDCNEESVIQYTPEPYPLTYPQLDEVPRGDILTSVLGYIPDQNGIKTDCLLLPLSSLLDHCLSLPLLTQNYLVNSALLDHFLSSCHMTNHFLSLKRFLLMEDGEFAHSLATQLFHQLMYGGSAARLSSPAFLNPLLQSALDSSLHGNSPYTQLLSFAVSRPHTPVHPYAVDALDYLSLSYKVEWPCNIVITDTDLEKYNKVFHLLLQLRRTSWALKNVFTQLQKCEGLEMRQQRQLQIQRHELQHFVDVMQGYITNQLFYLSWRELEDDLATKVHSLDDLITAHQTFIDKAIFRCLLSKKAVAVMSIIRTIFSSILRFCSTLTSSVHPSPHHHYHTMCHTHRKFRETAGLLMKVISKLVQRGYQPHLEDFLLRLNFNNFYG